MAHVFGGQQGDPTDAVAVRLLLVRSWWDGIGHAHDLVADAEDHLERLAYDQQVIAALRLDGFEGPAWEEFTKALVAYASAYLQAWIRSGLIIVRCRERGIWLPSRFLVPLQDEDAEELADEVLADAVLGFRKLLREGHWTPTGGATLTTFFVGQCIVCFPNQYRAWLRARWPETWVPLSELDQDTARVASAERQIDPAEAAVATVELQQVSDRLDERTLHSVVLQHLGYRVVEIAELLGESPKAIEMALYRHRRRMRSEGGTE